MSNKITAQSCSIQTIKINYFIVVTLKMFYFMDMDSLNQLKAVKVVALDRLTSDDRTNCTQRKLLVVAVNFAIVPVFAAMSKIEWKITCSTRTLVYVSIFISAFCF